MNARSNRICGHLVLPTRERLPPASINHTLPEPSLSNLLLQKGLHKIDRESAGKQTSRRYSLLWFSSRILVPGRVLLLRVIYRTRLTHLPPVTPATVASPFLPLTIATTPNSLLEPHSTIDNTIPHQSPPPHLLPTPSSSSFFLLLLLKIFPPLTNPNHPRLMPVAAVKIMKRLLPSRHNPMLEGSHIPPCTSPQTSPLRPSALPSSLRHHDHQSSSTAADPPSTDSELVEMRRLGQTNLGSKTPSDTNLFSYVHLRAPLPQPLENSEIFGNSAPESYFLMRRSQDGFVSSTGMSVALAPVILHLPRQKKVSPSL